MALYNPLLLWANFSFYDFSVVFDIFLGKSEMIKVPIDSGKFVCGIFYRFKKNIWYSQSRKIID